MTTEPQKPKQPERPYFHIDEFDKWKNRIITLNQLEQPNLNDYINKQKCRYIYEKETTALYKRCMTNICKTIDDDVKTWQNIRPNWLNGAKMIMLNDILRNSRTGELVKILADTSDPCDICNLTHPDQHPTLHRLINCTGYQKQKEELRRILSQYPEGEQHKVFQNRMHLQTILRLLAECALKITK